MAQAIVASLKQAVTVSPETDSDALVIAIAQAVATVWEGQPPAAGEGEADVGATKRRTVSINTDTEWSEVAGGLSRHSGQNPPG